MAVTKDRIMYATETAKPYLGRALRDDEFRDNLRAAFAAARAIYEELGSQRGFSSVASRAATDEEIHANLRRAIVYGSVVASFVVEDFSLRRLHTLTRDDIDRRYRQFVSLTEF